MNNQVKRSKTKTLKPRDFFIIFPYLLVLNIPVQVSFAWQDDNEYETSNHHGQRDTYNYNNEGGIITLDNVNTMYSTPRSTSYSQFEAFATSKRGK